MNKHLMLVFDKPMLYYPLSALMLAKVRHVTVICKSWDMPVFQALLGDGEQIGLELHYVIQDEPRGIAHGIGLVRDSTPGDSLLVALGDNFLFGRSIAESLQQPADQAHILCFSVENLCDYGVAQMDARGKISALTEKPSFSLRGLAIAGVYALPGDAPERARSLQASARGEIEILSLLDTYLAEGKLGYTTVGRGSFWQDMGTVSGVSRVSEFVRVWQERTGQFIGCLEEIALRNGWLSPTNFLAHADRGTDSPYTAYVQTVAEALSSENSLAHEFKQ